MTNNIQYRIDAHDVLFSDLLSNQRVKIPQSLFNEVSNELRDRSNDKRFSKKKIEITDIKKEDRAKASNVLKNMVLNDLIPTISYKINDTLTNNNLSMTSAMFTATMSNLVNYLTYNFLRMYPLPVRQLLAETIVIDIDFGMERLLETIKKDIKLEPMTETNLKTYTDMMKDPIRRKRYLEMINEQDGRDLDEEDIK